MKIRTSLVLAFFLLSVVPLGAIVVYSYYASRRALHSAYQTEGAKLTAQMDRRLTTIREELKQRLAEVSALPNLSQGNVLMTMGDVAPLVESVEIHAQAPEPPHPPMVITVPLHVDHGRVAITIGDATGHGARAGTMVAVIKALFAGYSVEQTPAEFLRNAAEKIRRMDLGRMAMALQLARLSGREVTLASAGMPPAYIHRRGTDSVEEIAVGATPLGTLGDDYSDTRLELRLGDTMLFLSDGFPELMNASGQQLGYIAAAEAFAQAARASDANGVIASLEQAARNWHGEQPPNDDVTFVVVRAV